MHNLARPPSTTPLCTRCRGTVLKDPFVGILLTNIEAAGGISSSWKLQDFCINNPETYGCAGSENRRYFQKRTDRLKNFEDYAFESCPFYPVSVILPPSARYIVYGSLALESCPRKLSPYRPLSLCFSSWNAMLAPPLLSCPIVKNSGFAVMFVATPRVSCWTWIRM
jgi:hypothetical protein